jgi:hypothetical protein
MGIQVNKIPLTLAIEVLVQFKAEGNTTVQGSYTGTFKRLPQAEIDALIDSDTPNSEVLDQVLVGVTGVGDENGELSPDEQLAWVKKTPECVGAGVVAFFRELRPARYDEKTSKTRRGRG